MNVEEINSKTLYLYKDEDALIHYGVKGMKWGVRRTPEQLGHRKVGGRISKQVPQRVKELKYQPKKTVVTKNGDEITLEEKRTSRLAEFLGKHNRKIAAQQDKTADFSIKDSNGKSIGDLELYKESDDSMNVVWVGINNSARGKGYATAVMKSAIQIAKDTNCRTITLEVPGNSPDARHIYEKLGFKETEVLTDEDDVVWGGLTAMRLDLKNIKHFDDGNSFRQLAEIYLDILKEMIDDIDSNLKTLTHYGIKGMKWGVRRTPEQLGHRKYGKRKQTKHINRSADRQVVDDLMKRDVKSLSDKELQTVLNRLGAEDRYKQLTSPRQQQKQQQKGKSWIAKTLSATGALATAAVSKALFKKGKKWTKDFMKGFERGYTKAQVAKDVADELRKRGAMTVWHSDEFDNFFLNDPFLLHYGVKGMKWGVRKEYEPHPRKKSSKQGAAKFKYKTEFSSFHQFLYYTPLGIPVMIADTINDSKQKKLYIDRSVISPQPKRSLSSLPKKKSNTSIEDDVKAINDNTKPGGVNNCANCVLAFDMRRRGYDVSAAPTNTPVNIDGIIKTMYNQKAERFTSVLDKNDIDPDYLPYVSQKTLAKAGYNKMVKTAEEKFNPGSRGFIKIAFNDQDIGHVFSWERDDKGINFYDTQTGKKRDVMVNFSSAVPAYELVRLDNLTPNDSITTRLKDGRK